jgi:hypothetical protein
VTGAVAPGPRDELCAPLGTNARADLDDRLPLAIIEQRALAGGAEGTRPAAPSSISRPARRSSASMATVPSSANGVMIGT